MALDRLTKIDGGGISTTSDYRVGIITATRFVGPIEGSITSTDANFTGNVTIGGTLTYEDVTNIDSVGIITARDGIDCNGNLVVAESIAVNKPRIVLSAPNDGTNYRHLFGANLKVDSSGTFTTPTANISGGGWEYLPANSLNAHGDIRYLSAPDTNATTSTPVERLRITSGGSIGIGTDNPQQDVHILRSQLSRVRIESTSTAYNSDVIFQNPDGLRGVVGYNATLASINIDSRGGTNGVTVTRTGVEKVRITGDGKVGIGTDIPVTLLHLFGSSGSENLIRLDSTDHKRNNFIGINGSDNLVLGADEDNEGSSSSIRFRIDGSEVVRFHNAGRIGINTDSPQGDLHIVADNPNIEFNDTNTSSNAEITLDNTALRIEVDEDNTVNNSRIEFRVDGSEKVRITSVGNVGIGTDNPGGEIDIWSGSPNIKLNDTSPYVAGQYGNISQSGGILQLTAKGDGATHGGIYFYAQNNSEILNLYRTSDNTHQWYTSSDSNSLKMRLLDSGNLGIGTATPQSILHIQHTTPGIRLSDSGNSGAYAFFDANAANAIIHADKGNSVSNSRVAFAVDNDEKMRIESSGRVLIGTDSSLNQYGSQSHLQVAGTSFDSSTIALRREQNNANPPGIVFAKSRSGTLGGNTIVQDDDTIGSLIFTAADGNDLTTVGAQIKVEVDGTPASNNIPGRIVFQTGGTAASNERLRIHSNGIVSIGDDHSGAAYLGADLNVVNVSGANMIVGDTVSGEYLEFIGTGGATSVGSKSNHALRFFTNGSSNERLRIDSSGNVLTSGTSQLFGSNTSDGSDNKSIMINGGGATSDTRGGYLLVHGNEHASNPGVTRLHAGNVGTAGIEMYTKGSERVNISSAGLTTLKNFNGTGLKLQGSGGDYQGMQLQVTDASASQTRNIFIDAVNETSAAVANQVGAVQDDGGSHWSWSTQPTGNRTDRRQERLRINGSGQVLIGQTSATYASLKLEINGSTSHGDSNYIFNVSGDSDNLSIRNQSNGDYEIVNSQQANSVGIMDGTGGARFEYAGNGNYLGMLENYAYSNRAYDATTTGGTEMRVTSDGRIRRAGSTRRLKNNIREYVGVGVSAIKQIVPKLWEDHNDGFTKLGFIAEEIHDIGLTNAVIYGPYLGGSEIGIGVTYGDSYGNGSTPVTKTGEALDDEVLVVEGLDTMGIIAELVVAVKQLTARIETLESGG